MDFIYSKLNNNLVDINRLNTVKLLKCVEEGKPLANLHVGDYYLEFTVVDSDKVNYCDLSDLNKEDSELLDRIIRNENLFNAHVDENKVEFESLKSSLSSEKESRENSDNILTQNLNAEINRAKEKEGSLETALINETKERESADESLLNTTNKLKEDLTSESSLRENKDSELVTSLNTLNSNLKAESKTREDEDKKIQTSLDTQIKTVSDNINTLIAGESKIREDNDNNLKNSIDDLSGRTKAIEDQYLKKDGSVVMTGNLYMGTSTAKNYIKNLLMPQENNDAANKEYVDGGLATQAEEEELARQQAVTALNKLISGEAEERKNADNDLQSKIDAVNAAQNFVGTVATYADLKNYGLEGIQKGDCVLVLKDENHNNSPYVYKLGDNNAWVEVGEVGDSYTKAQTEVKLKAIQDSVTTEATARKEADDKKQDKLISGTSIKTINNQDILGTGNIDIDSIEIINATSIDAATKTFAIEKQPSKSYFLLNYAGEIIYMALLDESTNEYVGLEGAEKNGKVNLILFDVKGTAGSYNLFTPATQSDIEALTQELGTVIGGLQEKLVSGTNLKTINNESLLGEGNIAIMSVSDDLILNCGTASSNIFE